MSIITNIDNIIVIDKKKGKHHYHRKRNCCNYNRRTCACIENFFSEFNVENFFLKVSCQFIVVFNDFSTADYSFELQILIGTVYERIVAAAVRKFFNDLFVMS